jgi:hypothetical protein
LYYSISILEEAVGVGVVEFDGMVRKEKERKVVETEERKKVVEERSICICVPCLGYCDVGIVL